MSMRSLLTALAAGLACVAPLAASAQTPNSAEDEALWCVYEALAESFDYEVVAEAYIFEGDMTGDPDGVLAKASATCAQAHDLNETQKVAVVEYGRFGAVVDYLTEELMFEGTTEAEINAIFAVMDGLSDDDYESLYNTGWEATEMGERVKAKLIAAKFPGEDWTLETAMMILTALAFADEAEAVFIFDGDLN
jgi:hypothetical protein